MSACVFVASGLKFDVDGYLKLSPFKPVSVFRIGEIPSKDKVPRPDSGFVVLVGEGEVSDLAVTALAFLTHHDRDLQAMREWGVDNLLLDFGVERTGKIQESHYLRPELVAKLGQLGMGLIFSTVQLPRG